MQYSMLKITQASVAVSIDYYSLQKQMALVIISVTAFPLLQKWMLVFYAVPLLAADHPPQKGESWTGKILQEKVLNFITT